MSKSTCFGDPDFYVNWYCEYHRCNCIDECRALKAENFKLLRIGRAQK